MKLINDLSKWALLVTLVTSLWSITNVKGARESYLKHIGSSRMAVYTKPAGKGKKPAKRTTANKKKSLKKSTGKARIKARKQRQKVTKKTRSKRKKSAISKKKLKKKSYKRTKPQRKKSSKKIKQQSKKRDLTSEKKRFFKASNSRLNPKEVISHAGKQMSKHANYFGFKDFKAMQPVYKKDPAKNRLAAQKIKEILRYGKRTEGPASGRYKTGYITYTLSNGHGASWHKGDGSFIGFRGPENTKSK